MSETADRENWWFRDAGLNCFGPVDRAQLMDWIQEGRIDPAGSISRDGQTWVPAVTDSTWGMDWIALFADGSFYGPLPKRTIERFVQNGQIQQPVALFSRDDAEKWQSIQEKVSEWQDTVMRQKTELERSQEENALLQKRIERADERAVQATLKAEDAEDELTRLRLQVEKGRNELSTVGRIRDQMTAELASLRTREKKVQQQYEKALQEIEEVRRQLRETEEALTDERSLALVERPKKKDGKTSSVPVTIEADVLSVRLEDGTVLEEKIREEFDLKEFCHRIYSKMRNVVAHLAEQIPSREKRGLFEGQEAASLAALEEQLKKELSLYSQGIKRNADKGAGNGNVG